LIRRFLPLLVVAAVLVVAGCGSKTITTTAANGQVSTHTTVHFAKTKFLLHAGLAFGTFHRYIYAPLKAGDFSHPLQHKAVVAKAALAGAFVYHEVKLALTDAQGSAILSKVVSPLTALGATLAAVVLALKHGHPNLSGISSANGAISSIKSSSSSAGANITEHSSSF
jgi:hypothetical protein